MKGQRLICLAIVITLSEILVTAYGYGTASAGRVSAATTPGYPDSSEDDHDGHDRDDNGQWGGPPNHPLGHIRDRDQHGQQSSPLASSQYDSKQQANYFSRSSHLERYGLPEGCVYNKDPKKFCEYFVEISKEPEEPRYIYFELFRHISEPSKGGWVAVGLSQDKFMGEDDMVECAMTGGDSPRMFHSWAQGRERPNRLPEDPDVIIPEATYPQYDPHTQNLVCKFKRPVVSQVDVPDRPPVVINLEKGKYYVLLSQGNIQGGNSDQLGYHGDKPLKNGKAYVSPNHLGYLEKFGKSGKHGYSSGNSGQTVLGFVFVLLYGFLRLVY